MIAITIVDNEILATENDKVVGKIEFTVQEHSMSILHTYAYERGKGIGSLLMETAMKWAKNNQYSIIPVCSFAQTYLEKHTKP